jgi:hypothetical protein
MKLSEEFEKTESKNNNSNIHYKDGVLSIKSCGVEMKLNTKDGETELFSVPGYEVITAFKDQIIEAVYESVGMGESELEAS